jgi:hypothetical protein
MTIVSAVLIVPPAPGPIIGIVSVIRGPIVGAGEKAPTIREKNRPKNGPKSREKRISYARCSVGRLAYPLSARFVGWTDLRQ